MSIGFKEWTLVCEALGRGEQSIIVRKGGIAEGRAGFRFQHPEFFLFPTLFHEQVAKLKVPSQTPLPACRADGQHEIRLHARVEWTREVEDLSKVQRLAPFHIWADAEIERRFRYEEDKGKRGVSVAFVRIEKMREPLVFPDSPKFGGCRSWIQIPHSRGMIAADRVLGDGEHRRRELELLSILGNVEP